MVFALARLSPKRHFRDDPSRLSLYTSRLTMWHRDRSWTRCVAHSPDQRRFHESLRHRVEDVTGHQQAVVLRTLELFHLGGRTTSGCSFSDDRTDSTVKKFAVRGVFLFKRSVNPDGQYDSSLDNCGVHWNCLPAQTLIIISRWVCLAVLDLALQVRLRLVRCHARDVRYAL